MRGGGTGGRSDRDDEAAVSLENFSPRSEEKIKTDPEARNNESPTLQAEQHWESCDCSGSPPPQCPGSPWKCLQQLIRCCGGCSGASPRTGRVTAKIDNAIIRTKQRGNAMVTMSKLTPHESEATMERLFPNASPARTYRFSPIAAETRCGFRHDQFVRKLRQ